MKSCVHKCISVPSWKLYQYHSLYFIDNLKKFDIFLPAATKLGQGNIFTSVCQEFCTRGGGGGLPQCTLGCSPPPRTRHPPPTRDQHTVNERPVRILLECILVMNVNVYSLIKYNHLLTLEDDQKIPERVICEVGRGLPAIT